MFFDNKNIYEALRFGIVGVIATVLHYGIYLFLKDVTGLNLAYSIGYFVSFVVNYILSACFTFRKKRSLNNALGFCCAHLFNYFLQTCLLNLFVWMGIAEDIAPLPVYCIAVPVNFVIVRLVFNKFK